MVVVMGVVMVVVLVVVVKMMMILKIMKTIMMLKGYRSGIGDYYKLDSQTNKNGLERSKLSGEI